jgi:hypothetical protein
MEPTGVVDTRRSVSAKMASTAIAATRVAMRAIADQHRAGGDRNRQQQGQAAGHTPRGVAEQRDAGDIHAEQQHEPRVGGCETRGDGAEQEEIAGRNTALTVV